MQDDESARHQQERPARTINFTEISTSNMTYILLISAAAVLVVMIVWALIDLRKH